MIPCRMLVPSTAGRGVQPRRPRLQEQCPADVVGGRADLKLCVAVWMDQCSGFRHDPERANSMRVALAHFPYWSLNPTRDAYDGRRGNRMWEETMPLFITRGNYPHQTMAGMMAKPE